MELKIEVGKFYTTRGGQKVKIYSIGNKDHNHVHGAVYNGACWEMHGWSELGEKCRGYEAYYDIVSEWQEPLDFDWACLPEWADMYIAMDKYGDWLCFRSLPSIDDSDIGWDVDFVCQIHPDYAPLNYTGSWNDSLFLNPKYKDKK